MLSDLPHWHLLDFQVRRHRHVRILQGTVSLLPSVLPVWSEFDIDGKLLYGINRCLAVFVHRHFIDTLDTHGACNLAVFSPVQSALYSITIGSIIAQATPCGVS